MGISISRNVRSQLSPDKKTWAEIADPSKKCSHFALYIGGDHNGTVKVVEDMRKLKEAFGGDLYSFSGSEWNALCKEDAEHLRPVGAQFSRTYWILLFNM